MTDFAFPQDEGIGTHAAGSGDKNDAANFAATYDAVGLTDFVKTGMEFTPTDSGTNGVWDTLDISAGKAVVTDASATATQTGESRDEGVAFVVETDARTGLTLTENAVNHVFLDLGLTSDDGISFHIDTDDTPPTQPHLKIGTVDTGNSTTSKLNRDAKAPPVSTPSVSTDEVSLGSDGPAASFGEIAAGAIPTPDEMSQPLADMPVAFVDNKLVSVGGYREQDTSDIRNATLRYDFDTQSWSAGANAPISVWGATAVSYDGSVYWFGGRDSAGTDSSAMYEYDPAADTHTQLSSMPVASTGQMALVHNDQIWIFSGYGTPEVYTYDPSTDTYDTSPTNLPNSKQWGSIGYHDDKFVIVGGGGTSSEAKTTRIYDIAADSWSTGTASPVQIYGSTMRSGKIPGGSIYCVYRKETTTNTFYRETRVYDIAADSWRQAPVPPYSGKDGVGSAYNSNTGVLHVLGGRRHSPGWAVDEADAFHVGAERFARSDVEESTSATFRAYLSLNQSIPNNSQTPIEYDSFDDAANQNFNRDGSHAFEADLAGTYRVELQTRWTGLADQEFGQTFLVKNGSNYATTFTSASGTTDVMNTLSKVVDLEVGDTLQVNALQQTGAAIDIVGNAAPQTFVDIHMVSDET